MSTTSTSDTEPRAQRGSGTRPQTQPGAGTPAVQPPAAVVVRLSGVGRQFGERVVLRELTFELRAGQTLVVLGRNGAGKSTLLRMLATLLRPHAGRLELFDQPLPREAWRVRARIGLLGHEPLLYRDLTGRENLRYQARLYRVPQARIERVLEAVGMSTRADEPVRSLSRGMVQRLAVARAVLHEPELLLLDEPRSNLDPAAAELVEPLIGRASGRTRVLTSHDPQAALAQADLVLALSGGRAAYVGAPAGLDDGLLASLYR